MFHDRCNVTQDLYRLASGDRVRNAIQRSLQSILVLPQLRRYISMERGTHYYITNVLYRVFCLIYKCSSVVRPLTTSLFTNTIARYLFGGITLFIYTRQVRPGRCNIFVLQFGLQLAIGNPERVPIFHTILCDSCTTYYGLTLTKIALTSFRGIASGFFI